MQHLQDRLLNVSLLAGSPAHRAYHARAGSGPRPPLNLHFFGGKTIADSIRRARSVGVTTRRAAELIGEYRAALPDTAMVWMTYPPDDPSSLPDAVAASGVDGFLIPLQARAYGALARQLEAYGVRFIHFLEHDPHLRDVQAAVDASSGYVMLQANPGPTGIRPPVLPECRT